MGGFLEHLIQRSLSEGVALRPRPVSIFEPVQPSPAADERQTTLFEFEHRSSVNNRILARRRFTAAHEPNSGDATDEVEAAPSVAMEAHSPVSAPHPAVQMTLRNGAWQRGQRVSSNVESPTKLAAAHVSDTSAAPTTKQATRSALEEPKLPTSKNTEREHEKLRLPQGHSQPNALQPRAVVETESDLFEVPAPLRSRRLQVQGKLAAPDLQPTSDNVIHSRAPTSTQFTAPQSPIQNVARSEFQEQPVAAEATVRRATTLSDSMRKIAREEPAAPIQAILAPLLPPHLTPLPQPVSVQAAEPVVHVTIGRVEIRAVSAAAAESKRATPPKPALSLSDYLHRRSGGRA